MVLPPRRFLFSILVVKETGSDRKISHAQHPWAFERSGSHPATALKPALKLTLHVTSVLKTTGAAEFRQPAGQVICHPRDESMRVKQTLHRTVGRHADHHPPAGRKSFAMVCACIEGHEACPQCYHSPHRGRDRRPALRSDRLIPVQHSPTGGGDRSATGPRKIGVGA